jgi:hypothetical protein
MIRVAKCAAVSVELGGKKWIDGACALTDSDGDVVFSTFDTRDLDESQPKMDCGTHVITGGTGKYKGITGTEPFACITVDTPAGEPEGSFAIDIPHNTTWEIYICERLTCRVLHDIAAGNPFGGPGSLEAADHSRMSCL